ncbi:hypothetical protein Tco_0708438 [Tanacetum coccineum]
MVEETWEVLRRCHEGSDDRLLYVWYENGERLLRAMAPLLSKRTTYSALMVEMDNAVYFLENHDVRQHPMNVHTPLMLLRST